MDDLPDIARTCLYGIPHLLLVIMIARIIGMLGLSAICPCLHPTELSLRLIGSHGIDKHREPRFIRTTNTAIMTRLLERDEIIPAVKKCLAKSDGIFDYSTLALTFAIRTHAMAISSCVAHKKICMLRQRTTAIIEIMDLNIYAFCFTKRHKFLLHGIPRKGITNTKDADDE